MKKGAVAMEARGVKARFIAPDRRRTPPPIDVPAPGPDAMNRAPATPPCHFRKNEVSFYFFSQRSITMSKKVTKKVVSLRPAVLLACFCFPALALAQVPPQDAGRILRETETMRPPPEPPRHESVPLPKSPETDAAAVKDDGGSLLVRAFRIERPEPLDAAEVEAALASFTGRALSMTEIDAAARVVAALYHARGYYLARAIIPPQDARDGTLRVVVTVGHYGTVRLHNNAEVRDSQVAAIFADVTDGETVRRAALERALLLISDLPGQGRLPNVSARPGQKPGTVDMDVTVEPGKPVDGFVVHDNQGTRFTGRQRLGAGLTWNAPLGLGDKLTLTGAYGGGNSRHSGVGRLAYSLPLAPGLRVETAVEHSDYELGGHDFESLDATGTSDSVELGARYFALREQNRSLELSARVSSSRLRDDYDSYGLTIRKKVTNGTLGARLDQSGQLFGNAWRGVAWRSWNIPAASCISTPLMSAKETGWAPVRKAISTSWCFAVCSITR
jgi:hemolysin activation/secretion protein